MFALHMRRAVSRITRAFQPSSTSAGIEMEGAGTFHMQNDARVSVAVCGNLTGQPELSDTISNKQLHVVYPTQHSVYRALA
jgi:hypothetical protein